MRFDWDAIKCFVAVAKHGSLTDASRALELSIATLGRRIDSLESSLGFKLFRRNQSGAQLTSEGIQILKLAEPGARQMAQIGHAAKTLKSGPDRPAVRISSTEPIISDVLSPGIAALLDANPKLKIEFDVSTDLANLNSGDVDIAIRLAKPIEDTLLGRRLPSIGLALFCSPGYLNGRNPNYLTLSDERLLWLDSHYGEIPENSWAKKHQLETAISMRSSSMRALKIAALNNAGIAPLPIAKPFSAGLIQIAAPKIPQRKPWIVFHRDTKASARMKLVRSWVVERCSLIFAK